MPDKENFIELLKKYTSETISAEERSELLAYIASGLYNDILLEHIENNLLSSGIEGAGLPPHRAAAVLHKIFSSEKQNALLISQTSAGKRIFRWALAAAVAGIIAFSGYLITEKNKGMPASESVTGNMNMKANTSDNPLKIEMEEGSIITLQPGAVIRYPAHFLPGKREIFLEGEAFFEVTKNASRPLFVYDKNIVAHVLGTSFSVGMNRETKKVEVSVRSGRVEVYENVPAGKVGSNKSNNGVILLPNQKVVYDQDTRQFVPSLVDVPLPVAEKTEKKNTPAENFVFEETPLKTVLGNLEKTYGIDIMVETEDIYKCLFTGDVSRQDLYARLDIICQSVQASWEIKGTNILIKGKGCK